MTLWFIVIISFGDLKKNPLIKRFFAHAGINECIGTL